MWSRTSAALVKSAVDQRGWHLVLDYAVRADCQVEFKLTALVPGQRVAILLTLPEVQGLANDFLDAIARTLNLTALLKLMEDDHIPEDLRETFVRRYRTAQAYVEAKNYGDQDPRPGAAHDAADPGEPDRPGAGLPDRG